MAETISVYVHLPFCARKCHYCNFNSRPAEQFERERYLRALHREIQQKAKELGDLHVPTVFFGGGTPTIFTAAQLIDLLTALRASFDLSPTAEITVEANPETVDARKLRDLRAGGFNRLSIGAQSFDDNELAMLGRRHTAEQTERAVAHARAAGFENVSLDLIYALPGQTVERWRATLQRALALRLDHLSAYGLELEGDTPLAVRVRRGEISPVAESEHLAMREVTIELCEEAGLVRYEISNYARPGFECRHNLTYWRNEPYLGLGAGAWSYLRGVRSANVREPDAYCAAIEAEEQPREYAERLDPASALLEAVMMGLRIAEGVSLGALRRDFGAERVNELVARARPLAEMGLLEVTDERLRLTRAGEPLHSEIVVRLA